MDLQQLKSLSQEDAFKWAGEFSGVPSDVLDSLWEVESGRGRNMVSSAGARGHFQIMPGTRKLFEKRFGHTINPDDFHESLYLAAHHLKDDLRREAGDVENALRAYNNGPKWREQADPRGENAAYAGKVLAAAKRDPVAMRAENQQSMAQDAIDTTKGQMFAGSDAESLRGVDTAIQADNLAAQATREDTGVFDVMKKSWDDARDNAIISMRDRVFKPEADRDFDLYHWEGRDKFLEGAAIQNEEEFQFIRQNMQSVEDSAWVMEQLQKRREADKVYDAAGPGAAFAGRMAVGLADPVGLGIGLGVGKVAQVGIKAARLATAAGAAARGAQVGRTVGIMAAEGAAGNVLWEGIQAGLGEVKTLEDYAFSAAFGTVFSTLGMPSAVRGELELANLGRAANDVGKLYDPAAVRGEAPSAQTPIATAIEDIGSILRETAPGRKREATTPVIPRDLLEPEELPVQAPVATPAPAAPVVQATPAATPDSASPALSAQDAKVADLMAEMTELHSTVQSLRGAGGQMPRAGTARRAEFDEANAKLDLLTQQAEDLMGPQARATIRAMDRNPDGSAITFAAGAKQKVEDIITQGLTSEAASPGRMQSPTDLPASALRVIANNLLASLPKSARDMEFQFNAAEGVRNLASQPRLLEVGAYNPATNTGRLPGRNAASLPASDIQGRNPFAIAVHEIAHAATARVILAIQSGLDVPVKVRKAYDRLETLRGQLKDKLIAEGRYNPEQMTGAMYATKNADEFTAQLFSDRDTIETLAKMPGDKYVDESALGKAFRSVLNLLGMERVVGTPRSAAEEAAQLTEQIIRYGDQLPEGVDWDAMARHRVGNNSAYTSAWLGAPGLSPQQHSAKEVRFVQRMYAHAADWLTSNPIDQKKVQTLANKATKGKARDNLVSDGLKMASSKNPLVRMLAGITTEVTTGAAGRRATAAVQQHLYHHKIVGQSIWNYDTARARWAKANGGGIWEAALKGEKYQEFDRAVTEEIWSRRNDRQWRSTDKYVAEAADHMQALYQRSLDTQKGSMTLGSHYLPPDAIGYAPQALKGDALRAAGPDEAAELAAYFTDHWQQVYGWDRSFAGLFSEYYMRRAKMRAAGQKGVDFVATESPSAAVQDTLEMMHLEMKSLDAQARASLDAVGAQPQNKKRLDVDMMHTLPSGKRVLDYYEDNALGLARAHARRVAGASALADFNILGQRGINQMLRAVDDSPPGMEATIEERASLERVFAEFMSTPYSGEYRNRFAAGASSLTRLLRMGGLAFTQLGETANAIHILGLRETMASIGALPRMFKEVRDSLDGKSLSNPWLGTTDRFAGFDLGTEQFMMATAFDPTDDMLRAYGKGQNGFERILQGGNYAQAKVSFFRGLHASQHRAMAERVVIKAIDYLDSVDPKAQVYLDDMGFNAQMRKAIKPLLANAVKRDAAGNAVGFDLDALGNTELMEDFTQAVHRGTMQIIQGTFIGERGAWAHNDVTKMVAQLRTFGLTATEKQWARNRMLNDDGPMQGYGYAAGVLMGQMAFVLPIYLARVQVNAMGREDREDYIEQALMPAALMQALMNYSTAGGLAGDAFDQVFSMAGGWNDDAKATLGTRSFSTGVGGLVPSFGTADSYMRLLQGKGDLAFAAKQLPGSNLPYVQWVINQLR